MSRAAWACQARSLGCYWPSECTAFVSARSTFTSTSTVTGTGTTVTGTGTVPAASSSAILSFIQIFLNSFAFGLW